MIIKIVKAARIPIEINLPVVFPFLNITKRLVTAIWAMNKRNPTFPTPVGPAAIARIPEQKVKTYKHS